MKNRAEVVIVGGGVTGAACAYYLARAGRDVLLVEREDLAAGTSSACDGFVILQTKNPGLHLELALKSAELYRDLPQELDHDIEYRQCGGMIAIEGEEELAVMEKFMARQQKTGLDVQLVTGAEARELEPALGDHIVGATVSGQCGQVNPLELAFAFAGGAKRNGARFLLGTPVTDIRTKGGRVRGVVTPEGEIATELVINAAGVWAPRVGHMVGLDIPIKPRRGQLVVSERVPPLVTRVMNCARYIAAKYKPELLEGNPDPAIALGVGLALEQTAHGSFLIGSTREFAGFDRQTTPAGITAVVNHACRIIPALKKLHMVRTFAGLRPYTPDGLPILGPVPGVEGFIMAAGHEGDGIALAPVTGLLISQLLTGGEPELPLTELALERFFGSGVEKESIRKEAK